MQLTHDGQHKMSPQFSPDSSRIAYTVPWDTWTVPVLGGEPRRMLPNAAGLIWIGPQRLLFSEIKSGLHMAIVSASESRTEAHDVYVPPHERGMAHRSYLSPDRKWVLLAEMDNGGWLPCRVVPFDGSSPGRPVGPPAAACTDGGWSPDGKWVYLSSNAGGKFHIWRQRFERRRTGTDHLRRNRRRRRVHCARWPVADHLRGTGGERGLGPRCRGRAADVFRRFRVRTSIFTGSKKTVLLDRLRCAARVSHGGTPGGGPSDGTK